MLNLTIEDKAIELMSKYPCGIRAGELIKETEGYNTMEVFKKMVEIAQFERGI